MATTLVKAKFIAVRIELSEAHRAIEVVGVRPGILVYGHP